SPATALPNAPAMPAGGRRSPLLLGTSSVVVPGAGTETGSTVASRGLRRYNSESASRRAAMSTPAPSAVNASLFDRAASPKPLARKHLYFQRPNVASATDFDSCRTDDAGLIVNPDGSTPVHFLTAETRA